MNILIVDDEFLIREVIKEYCLEQKYNTFEAGDGIEAINIVSNNPIDLIVLDIMMPKKDGYTALLEIKKMKNIPVILLSARSEESDKLQGFDLGVDDYLTKPFSPKELMARIKNLLKRNNIGDFFQYQSLNINYSSHIVTIDNNEIKLTPKEYELLIYFIKNKNIALSREQLLNQVWSYDFYGDDRTIDTHIKMLRNNLLQYRNLIVTVRGMGYRFEIK